MILSDLDDIFISGKDLSPKEIETVLRVFQRSFKLNSIAIRRSGGD